MNCIMPVGLWHINNCLQRVVRIFFMLPAAMTVCFQVPVKTLHSDTYIWLSRDKTAGDAGVTNARGIMVNVV